jgi:hypothetical protein
MSDERKPPPASPARPAARPSTNPGVSTTGLAARTPTNPAMRPVSAARSQPVPEKPGPVLSKERLKDEAANTALNAVSILKETVSDFQGASRFFKYKVAIIGAWALVSVVTLAFVLPSRGGPSNDLGAVLIATEIVGRPVVSIRNGSEEPWENVVVQVNGAYRAALATIAPNGTITLTPTQLLGAQGEMAGPDLKVREVRLQTTEGEAVLMENGVRQ